MKKTKKIRTLIRKSLILVTALMIFNCMYMAGEGIVSKRYLGNLEFNEAKTEANSFDYCQDNYYLYVEKNGIKTAPLFFGERLYLYSIDKNRKYLVKGQYGLWDHYMKNYTLVNEKILYEEDLFKGGGSGEITCFNMKTGKGSIYVSHDSNMYAVHDNHFISGGYENEMYREDMHTGKGRTLFTPQPDEFPETRFVAKGKLYIYHDDTNDMTCIDLKTDEADDFKWTHDDYPAYMEGIGQNKVLILLGISGELWEYDSEDLSRTMICDVNGEAVNEYPYHCHDIEVRNGDVYCNTDTGDVVVIDYETGRKQTIIDISSYIKKQINGEDIFDMVVSYCTDYIVIDIYFDDDSERILIFDYDGNFIRRLK